MKLIAISVFSIAAVLAQTTLRNDEPASLVLSRVPTKARAKCNPFATDRKAGIAGRKVFEQHCAECHGAEGDGTRRGPRLRESAIQQATAGEIFWILTNGVVRRGMPAWSKLPEPQRWQVVTWLKSLQ